MMSKADAAKGDDVFTGAPVTIPGGALDPACRPLDVYLDPPAEADPGASPAARMAQSYVNYVNARRYDEISSLFVDDGVSLPPSQQVVQGREALDAFYPQIAQVGPKLMAVGYTSSDRDCFIEMALEQDVGGERRYVLVGVNHFTVNADGKATRMLSYVRAREPVFQLK
jgi:hypothetical protein